MERLIRWSLCSAFLLTTTTSSAAIVVIRGQDCGETLCTEGCNTTEGCSNRKGENGNCKNGQNGNEGVYRLSKGQIRRLNRQCPPVVKWRAYGMDWAHNCGPVGQAARLRIPGAKCVRDCMRTKGSPDSGWSPPCRMPVNRMHTGFASYSNFGNSYAGAPMVYQPTDTAQLGYSYAHVPTWQRRPNMVPATPTPSMFHARFCPRGGSAACGGGSYCAPANGMGGGYPVGGNCPTGDCQSGEVIDAYSNGSYCAPCQAQAAPKRVAPKQQVASKLAAPQQAVASITKPRQLPPVRTVSVKKAQTGPTPLPTVEKVAKVSQPKRVQTTKPVIQVKRSTQQQRPQQQPRQRQVRRSTNQQQKSGGWFGLPSLSEMKF